MLEALTAREVVQRIVLAAYLGQHPGSFRMQRAYREAERILVELKEAEMAETCRHYAHELTGEEN